MGLELNYHTVNVFTGGRLLGGNQLAVFTDAHKSVGEDEKLMQLLARQLNLSETVFVFPPTEDGHARLRLFSTVTEVPFAGHPILGTAAVLASLRPAGLREARLETGRGIITVSLDLPLTTHRYLAWMNQPIPEITPFPYGEELLRVLGIERSVLPIECYDAGIPHLYVTAETVEQVEQIVPDFARLGAVARRCRINVLAGSGTQYTSRMFSPFDYVPEDPACGSAAGPLALHLLRHGRIQPKQEITISQGAQVCRPSTLHAAIRGTAADPLLILVGGEAHLIGEGTFRLT